MTLTLEAVAAFERCVRTGGVAVFPADTVYGLACDPTARRAVERLNRLKHRSPKRSAAVMFFSLEPALVALPELGARTRAALVRLLPGAVTALVPNPARRYPLACGEDAEVLGLRVPELDGSLAPLAGLPVPVLQSSANRTGGRDIRRLDDLEESIRRKVDLALDAGELPGSPSTVVDLTRYEEGAGFEVLREGAVPRAKVAGRLA
jgi:L-threonylcarbamoyladenylate synthase